MFAVRSRNFHFSLMLATALSVSMLPSASQAYTPEQEQACSGDAFRLCSADIPDVDRITACMIRNKSQLTPGCRAFFREPESTVTPAAAGKPLSIRTAERGYGTRLHRKLWNPEVVSVQHVETRADQRDAAQKFEPLLIF
jgi:hypothetical protein